MCNAIFNSSAVHCHQTEYWPQRKFGNDTWTFFVVDWNRLTVNGASLYTRHGVSRPREWVFSPREQVVTFFRTFIRLRQPPFFLYIHMKRHIFRVAQEGFTYLWYFDLATFLTRSKNVLVWHRKNNHSDTQATQYTTGLKHCIRAVYTKLPSAVSFVIDCDKSFLRPIKVDWWLISDDNGKWIVYGMSFAYGRQNTSKITRSVVLIDATMNISHARHFLMWIWTFR